MPKGTGTSKSSRDLESDQALMASAEKLGFTQKSAEVRIALSGKTEFKRELTAVRKARKVISGSEAIRRLRELGREGLASYVKRLSDQRNLPPAARKQQGDVVLADITWGNIRNVQGVAWVVVTEGSNIVAELDLLIVFNGQLSGPVAKLPKRSKGFVEVPTYGHGLVLGQTEWAAFGLLPPRGRTFGRWEPCYFEGDPREKANLTSVKALADACEVQEGLPELMQRLGYKKRAGGGIPISFLKRAVNDTMKLAGYSTRPRWIDCPITTESTEEDIAVIGDEEARQRLHTFWFCDEEETPDTDKEGVSIWEE